MSRFNLGFALVGFFLAAQIIAVTIKWSYPECASWWLILSPVLVIGAYFLVTLVALIVASFSKY